MIIESINLSNYRNFSRLSLQFNEGINIFIGKNGQGKTNLLEAIYLLTKGKSFRPGTTDVLVQKDNEHQCANAKANLVKNQMSYLLQCRITDSRKQLLVNDKKLPVAQLINRFPSIIFSPESLSAIKEGPSNRRELVDEFLCFNSESASKVITDYNRSLKQRNKLLKEAKLGNIPKAQVEILLQTINEMFLPIAAEFTYLRIQGLNHLKPDIQTSFCAISGYRNVDISVDYIISSQSSIDWDKNKIYDALSIRLQELKRAELESGSSLIGPHKHDIKFMFNGEDSRYFCSQGQQRALILSYKMAQILYHQRIHKERPLLLLDDVLSELDKEKRVNLVEFLKTIDAQIFITTTDDYSIGEFESNKPRVFRINNGQVNKSEMETVTSV